MNKAELIDGIATYTQQPKAIIDAILVAQANVIVQHLFAADPGVEAEVTLPHLGKLKTRTRAARPGRNPQTGAPVEIPERIVVRFSAGKVLDDILNP